MIITLFHTKPRADIDTQAYEAAFGDMYELASQMPGFVSFEGFAGSDGSELAVVRFASAESLEAWRAHPDHLRMQERGRVEFYDTYDVTVAEVTRTSSFPRVDA